MRYILLSNTEAVEVCEYPDSNTIGVLRAHSICGGYIALHRRSNTTTAKLLSNRQAVPNPSIERTYQRPLRALWCAAHIKRS
ncbi:MAG: hypothetical protein ABI389_12180 [Rhodanobacter sp.]